MKLLGMSLEDLDKHLKNNNLDMENILVATMDEDNEFIYQLKKAEVKK